ncbi:hypothetical protein [Streptomyces sp. NPDC047097]|uniref:hypothetical protein n=1 Tax=Streptomyces sp. NPDC047097 TaxID=3155260 RepID=UPI0033EE4DE5
MAVTRSRVAIAAAGGLLMLATGVGTAEAGSAAPEASRFARQAESAQLTRAQTTALQSEVNGYLKGMGGTQVALNKIDLDGRGEVLVALPGEARPRDFASGDGTRVVADPCLAPGVSGNFCAYKESGFEGTRITMWQCGTRYYVSTWGRGGSWINDQTRGLESRRARMYNPNGTLIYRTPVPYSSDSTGDWQPVRSVIPCG